MIIHPYQLEELQFAWCYRVYYQWRTHRNRAQRTLAELDQANLDAMLQPYGIRILETAANESGVKMLVSLLPDETVAGCAGKAKGRVSKRLHEAGGFPTSQKLLSRGYFACTAGKSTTEAVDRCLSQQSAHHGYASRQRPPVFVHRYPITSADERRLNAQHAVTLLQLHVVLATWKRKGVFGRTEGEAVASHWRQMQDRWRWFLQKVSFVPDHVHLALRIHPTVSPARLVAAIMNAAQELLWDDFADGVVRAGIQRLWQPSAYVGAYGSLESAQIAAYIRRWEGASPGQAW